jgi:hypothetical protein
MLEKYTVWPAGRADPRIASVWQTTVPVNSDAEVRTSDKQREDEAEKAYKSPIRDCGVHRTIVSAQRSEFFSGEEPPKGDGHCVTDPLKRPDGCMKRLAVDSASVPSGSSEDWDEAGCPRWLRSKRSDGTK